jgi:type IV pilus assembly protein PilF
VQLGLGYLEQGDLPRAKKKLFYALSLEPNRPGVVGAVAYYFDKTGQAQKAEENYLKALSLAKYHGAELNNYGAFLCRQKRYAEADRYFVLATKDVKYLNTAGAYENAGICALERKNTTLAKQYFNQALENDPRRELSVLELMKLYNQDKEYEKTLEVMDKYELVASIQPKPIYLAYLAARDMGRLQAARGYAWILKKRFPHTEQYQQLVEGSPDYVEQNSRVG